MISRKREAADENPDARGSGSGGMGAGAGAGAGPGDAGAPVPGASYVVPAGPDTPEGRYPIASPTTRISGDEFRVDYKLPALLLGEDQSISLRGTIDPAHRIATVASRASRSDSSKFVDRCAGQRRDAVAPPKSP
jgi:hypothetical protein